MKYRVIPMQCGNDESYALVFYEQDDKVKVDVYDASTKGKVVSLDSPFPVGGIPDIRYVQSYDVLFFAQPDTYPCKFKRENDEESGGYKFSFEDSEFLPEPVMEWDESRKHSIRIFAKSFSEQLVGGNDYLGFKGYLPAGSIVTLDDVSGASKVVSKVEKFKRKTSYIYYFVDGVKTRCRHDFWYLVANVEGATESLKRSRVSFKSGKYAFKVWVDSGVARVYETQELSAYISKDELNVEFKSGYVDSVDEATGEVSIFAGSMVVTTNLFLPYLDETKPYTYAVVDSPSPDEPEVLFDSATTFVDRQDYDICVYGRMGISTTSDLRVGDKVLVSCITFKVSFSFNDVEDSRAQLRVDRVVDSAGVDVSGCFSVGQAYESDSYTYADIVGTASVFAEVVEIYNSGQSASAKLFICGFDVSSNYPASMKTTELSGDRRVVHTGLDRRFYIARRDIDFYNSSYIVESFFSGIDGSSGRVLMTVDGGANSKSVSYGQIIAVRYGTNLLTSGMFSYDGNVNVSESPNPNVAPEERLPSKKDTNGDELRPESGGGVLAASESFPFKGSLTFKTDGVWSGVLELQELDEHNNVSVLATVSSENGLSNTELERDITEFGRRIRVACTRREYAYTVEKYNDGSTKTFKDDTGCQWTLSSQGDRVCYFRIVGKTKAYGELDCYEVELLGGCYEAFTSRSYALGAWSTKNGYPRHITIFQERLVYAGNKEKPMTVWMSKTNKWKDFELGTDDTSAITATLATEKYDSIEWLTLNKNSILLGSKYNEFSIGANDGTVTTADNILASTMSSIGGAAIPAAKVGTSTLMVKVGREELHKVEFNALSEQSTGTQVSMLARHLFEEDRIKDVFSIQSPRNMLFCVHESGKLSSLTYEQEFDVLGFARHDVLDGVESGCVIRRDGRDVLCMVVREGDSYVLGEIDFDSDVWTDDGKNYESEVLTTPMKPQSKYATSGYGRQMNIAGADVYVSSDSRQFRARLVGSDVVDVDWVRVDNGFNTDGELRGWDRQKVELPMTGSWLEEPMVEIKCDTAHPLTVYGVGAALAQGN